MSAILRGAKNAIRNPGRALAVTVILGLSLGLALTMAVAKQAVDARVDSASGNLDSVLSNLATTLVVRPAGTGGGFTFGGPGGQQATLDEANLTALKAIPHVQDLTQALTVQVQSANTSLASAVTFGGRGGAGGGGGRGGNFTIPVQATGADSMAGLGSLGTGTLTVESGAAPTLTGDTNAALLGSELAAHNNLVVGSTFTLYGEQVTVTAIASSSGNRFANNTLLLPLATLQRLAGRAGEVSSAVMHVDGADNVASVKAAATASLGDTADVANLQDQASQSNALASADDTLASLKGVSGLALTSLVGALGASVLIVFLTMTMVVRERRREIGVLKAIGAPTAKVVTQYATEAATLTILALAVALGLAVLFGNTVTHALVASNTASPGGGGPGGPGGPGTVFIGGGQGLLGVSSRNIDGAVDPRSEEHTSELPSRP